MALSVKLHLIRVVFAFFFLLVLLTLFYLFFYFSTFVLFFFTYFSQADDRFLIVQEADEHYWYAKKNRGVGVKKKVLKSYLEFESLPLYSCQGVEEIYRY